MLSVVNCVGLPLKCPEPNTPHEWKGTERIERFIEAQAFDSAPYPLSRQLARPATPGRLRKRDKLLSGEGGGRGA